jgi:hypothetical protein
VVFQGRQAVPLEEKYLVSDESALQVVKGQVQLMHFLDDARRIYRSSDAIDVDLFLDTVLKGATPSLDHSGAYPADAVHQRALASPKLRLFVKEDPLRNTVLKAVEEGRLLVRLPNCDVYDKDGVVSGPDGDRKREPGRKLPGLTFAPEVLLAPVGADCLTSWLEIGDPKAPVEGADGATGGGGGTSFNGGISNTGSPKADSVTALTWEEALAYATSRPLQKLTLKAIAPTDAKALVGLAQPLGATTLQLSVVVGGECKDGGKVNFAVNNVKVNSSLKPLEVAASLQRATADGSHYEARLVLTFDGGLAGASTKLARARDEAPIAVALEAQFGPEGS